MRESNEMKHTHTKKLEEEKLCGNEMRANRSRGRRDEDERNAIREIRFTTLDVSSFHSKHTGHDGRFERERINYNFDAPYNKWNAELWLKINAKIYKCDCVSSRTHRLLSIGGLFLWSDALCANRMFNLLTGRHIGLMVTTLWEVLGMRAFTWNYITAERQM